MDNPRPPGRGAPLPTRLVLALLVVAVAASFLLALLFATQGHFVPPVVDLYVVCQYARALAEGHPFRYNPGETPSTGATSLLYTAWLGLAHTLGARGEGLVAVAVATGAGLYAGSVALAFRLTRRLSGEREALLGAALVALGGPVVWSYFYGSDVALFLFLALLVFEQWLSGWTSGRLRGYAVAASLLALARPEGLPLAALLAAAALLGPGVAARRERLFALVPVATGLLVLAFQRLLTGEWAGSSVTDKTLLANYGLADTLGLASEYFVDVVRGLLLGFYPSQTPVGFARGFASLYMPPLALAFVLLAALRVAGPLRFPLRSWLAAVAAVAMLVGPNVFMGVHFNRYLVWACPGLLLLVAIGLGALSRLLAPGDQRLAGGLYRAGAGLFLFLGAFSTLRFATLYGEMAGEVFRRDVATAEWIRSNLPRGVRIANIATSVEYLTGHHNINLHGVTSPAFFHNRTAEREAGTFEALSRLEAAERPPYLLSSVSVQEGSALMRELAEGPPIYRSLGLGDELELFRMRWELPGKNAGYFDPASLEAAADLQEVDRLDVCDSRDEAAHAYRFESRLANLRLNGTLRIADYELPDGRRERVADAGRAILGHESFRISTRPGRDLVVLMRIADSVDVAVLRATGSAIHTLAMPEQALTIAVGGRAPARIALRPRPGWSEALLRIPGDLVVDRATELTLSGRYASFQYWFLQAR